MNKVKPLVQKHLAVLIFIAIYLILALTFIFLEGFVAESQVNILTILLPCVVLGIIVDFIVSRNTILNEGQKLFTRILPSGIILIYFVMMLFNAIGRPLSEDINYFYYLFLSAPFMIVSYQKEGHWKRMILALIGTVVVFSLYLRLTTISEQLDRDTGLTIFMVSYFMMYYSASRLRIFPYISVVLSVLTTAGLWYIYKNPITNEAMVFGWDYDYLLMFEYVMLINFMFCILIRLLDEFRHKR